MDRREFLKKTGQLGVSLGLTGILLEKFMQDFSKPAVLSAASVQKPVIVAVQLTGGMDGINTLVPYGIGEYYDARPTIGYKQSEILPINANLGFHNSMPGFKKMFDENHMAIIQNVGYPDSSRSHFEAQEIWQTASPLSVSDTGWLGRYVDIANESKDPLFGLSVGIQSKILDARTIQLPRVDDVRTFKFNTGQNAAEEAKRNTHLRNMFKNTSSEAFETISTKGLAALNSSLNLNQTVGYKTPETPLYPLTSGFSLNLSFIAQCIASSLPTQVYYTDFTGFDEHEALRNTHASVMKVVDQNLYGFYQDLKSKGILDRVVILVYTEFGRRIKENASGGTDHGTANPVFVIGGNVKGGLYGDLPNFNNLDVYGDFKHSIDFRQIYSTLMDNWMGASSQEILFRKQYENLTIF